LIRNGDVEEKKEDKAAEGEKYKAFAKVLHNIQTAYLN
jgi:hypothetical protein